MLSQKGWDYLLLDNDQDTVVSWRERCNSFQSRDDGALSITESTFTADHH